MARVQAQAVRWVSDDFPGFVEVQLTDADGLAWSLVDKVPVFGNPALSRDAFHPVRLLLDCEVISTTEVVTEVALAHGVATADGRASFLVPATAVSCVP